MTEQEINNIFTEFVSEQLFDCFDASEEDGYKVFMYLSGVDDFRTQLIKYLKEKENRKDK